MNHYQTLGVTPDADDVVIRAAYKALAQKYHPDKWPKQEQATAHARMAAINQAFAVLRDPARRRRYDGGLDDPAARSTAQPRASRPGSATAGWRRHAAPAVTAMLTLMVALSLGIERKSAWHWAWDFVVGGFERPSTYIIHWPVLGVVLVVGFLLAAGFARRTR